jgi:hypothetical protein
VHRNPERDDNLKTKGVDMSIRTMTRNLAVMTLAVAAISLAACENSDDVAGPALEQSTVLAAGIALPTTDAMVETTGANAQQKQGLSQARARWGSEPVGERPHPMHGFLAEAAGILDHGQMVALVNLVAETRGECDEQGQGRRHGARAQQRGPRSGNGGILEFADELGLSEEQIGQITALQEQLREQMQAIAGDRGRGQRLTEEQRDQVRALHAAHKEAVDAVLTEEQLGQLEQLRTERRDQRRQERQERGMERQTDRIEFLATVLKLSEGQVEAIEELMAAQHDEIRSLSDAFHESLGGERPTDEQIEDHREAIDAVRVQTNESIVQLLDEEQAELFEALSQLRNRPDRGPRGGGHGPRGGRR